MKKKLSALLSLLLSAAVLVGCQKPTGTNTDSGESFEISSQTQSSEEQSSVEESSSSQSSKEESSEESSSSSSEQETSKFLYNDFTSAEKELFLHYIGEVIPFAPNNDYGVEGYYEEDDYEYGMNFYTCGNSAADFQAYLQKYEEYTFIETYEDEYGDTWYWYEKGDVVVDLSYY